MRIPVVLWALSYTWHQYSTIGLSQDDFYSKIGSKNKSDDETFWYLSEITTKHLMLVSAIGGIYVGQIG